MKQRIPFRIGHVLIKVNNLEKAVQDYEALGFRVTYGSDPKKATNAMIYFKDGSFLELFSTSFGQPIDNIMKLAVKLMLARKNPYAGRMRNYTSPGEGFRDYALDSTKEDTFEGNMTKLKEAGITIHGPRNMKRKNVEQILVKWSLCFPTQERFPFFMSPYSPAPVLPPAKTKHPNGAAGFKELIITTPNWEEDLEFYQRIYQQKPRVEEEKSRIYCRFQLEETAVVLEKGHNSGIQKIIIYSEEKAENEGDNEAGNEADNKGAAKSHSLDITLSHGANITLS